MPNNKMSNLSNIQNANNFNNLDGLSVINADEIYIGGNPINLDDYIPYSGANKMINLGSQNIKTTHIAITNPELVNLGLLNSTISNLSNAIGASFLDKITTTPQTVIGDVSYTAQLSSDDFLVPTTKKANMGSVISVDANFTRQETDSGVFTRQYFGSITNSMGIYQATSTDNFAILQCADFGTGINKRVRINWNLNINEPMYNSSIQLFASSDGTTTNQYLGPSVSFTPSDSFYKVLSGTFVPEYRYLCVICLTAKPSGIQTVRWYGLDIDEQGVELEKVSLPSLTADRVAVINSKKQLVSSGISTTKLDYLDNVSSDIQTQLNNKLNLSGSNANQNIVVGSYKIQSTATPTVNSDYTTKLYVDNEISGAGSLYLLKTGGTMTGTIVMGSNKITTSYTPVNAEDLTRKGYVDTQDGLRLLKAGDTATGTIFNSAGDFHPYKAGDLNRGIVLFANNADGATYASYNGGLASWFGIGFKCTTDSTTRFVFDTRTGDSSQVGKLTAGAINNSGATANRVAIYDANKDLVSSSVSSTTLTYLDIGSSLVGLLNTKANLTGGNTFSGNQIFNSGSVSVSNRFLGEVDSSPSGNFWMGLRGTGTESDRLAVAIVGNQTTGVVDRVLIQKTLRLAQPTANRVLTLDTNGDVVSSTVSPLTLTYLDITSSLVGLLALKANLIGPNSFSNTHTFTSAIPIILSGLTASRVLQLNGSGNVESSTVSTTTLAFLDATSSIQTQLNARVLKAGDTMTGTLGLTSTNVVQFGSGVSGKDGNAGKIGYQTFTTGCLDIVGAGTTSNDRRVRVWDKFGVGTNPDIGILQIGGSGGTDYFTIANDAYSTGQYINQRFFFGSTSGLNRSVYIQAVLPGSNQTDLGFFVDSGSGSPIERFRISGANNGTVYVNGALGVGVSGTSIDTDLYVYGKGKFWNSTAGPPANGINGGTGTRLILWPGASTATPYGLGIDSGTLWYGTPAGNPHVHKWYAGTDNTMTLNSSGSLTLAGGLSAGASTFTGGLNVRDITLVNTNNINISNGNGAGSKTLLSQILMGWAGSQSQYRHRITTEHEGGSGPGGNGNSMNFYLWSNDNGLNDAGTNHRLTLAGGGVGVFGVVSPSYPLDVGGSGRFQNTLYITYSGGEGIYQEFINPVYATGGFINIKFNHAGTREAFIQSYLPGSNQVDLKFLTGNSGGGTSNRLELKGNGDINLNGNVFIPSANSATANIVDNTSQRLLIRDTDGGVRVGALSSWSLRNNSINWAGGVYVDWVCYLPSNNATMTVNITASAYSNNVANKTFGIDILNTAKNVILGTIQQNHYFNIASEHRQITTNFNYSGYTGWVHFIIYAYGLVSDSNDTLTYSITVLG